MKLLLSLTLSLLFTTVNQIQAQTPQIETVRLSDNFYLLYGGDGQGSNVGVLIEEEGIIVIDAMVEESGQKLLSAIRAISSKPIRYVFNTHGDFDHSGGNRLLASEGAEIIAHKYTKYNGGWSQLSFDKTFTLSFGNETIHAWHSPSHANSDIIIYLEKQNLLFMGDTFSNTWHPTFYARGMVGQYKVLEEAKAISNNETQVIPGHGFLAPISELDLYKAGCEAWMARMAVLHQEGRSLEEMIADKELGRLRQQFIARSTSGDMPDMNFQRLIQRTISSEFVEQQPLVARQMQKYIGDYRGEDDITVAVFLEDGTLFAAVEGQYMAELLPVGSNRFHLRAWIDHYFEFEEERGGQIGKLIHEHSQGQTILERDRQ